MSSRLPPLMRANWWPSTLVSFSPDFRSALASAKSVAKLFLASVAAGVDAPVDDVSVAGVAAAAVARIASIDRVVGRARPRP